MGDGGAIFLHDFLFAQARDFYCRGETRFDRLAITLEGVDQSLRTRLVIGCDCLVVEHQFDKLALRQQGRKVRQGQNEIAFVHRSQALEEAAPLFIDCRRNGIGKMRQTPIRVTRCWPAHAIDVHHPTVTEVGERLIDPERDHFALLVGAAAVVVALVEPRGHERAIFANDHAVIDHGCIVEQISEACCLGAVFFQLGLVVDGADARVQQQQHERAQGREDDGDGRDGHLYCLP